MQLRDILYISQHLQLLAPVADGLTAYKIVGHCFGLSYRKISGSNQGENIFFRISNISVPCPHAQLRGCTVIKKLWTFFWPGGRDRFQSPPYWIFRVNQIHPPTTSERTTRQLQLSSGVLCVNVYNWFDNIISQVHQYFFCYFAKNHRSIRSSILG